MLGNKNPNKDIYQKMKKCKYCSTVYLVNECSELYHKKQKCGHLKPISKK